MRLFTPLTTFALGTALLLGACEESGFENSFEVSSNITTERSSRFVLGSIFIDTRNANAAFLVINDAESGEVVESSSIPVGKTDPLTIILDDAHKLSPGLQQFEVTVYLDNPDAPNGELDDSDPIATAGSKDMQKTVTVEYTPSNSSYIDFVDYVETDNPRTFDLGSMSVREEDTGAKGAIVAAYTDADGARGDLLATRVFTIDHDRVVSITMESPNRLKVGEQTIHIAVYFEDPANGELDDSDVLGELDGEALEHTMTVNLTDDAYNPDITLETAITIETPFEFEVGTVYLPTEVGTRFWAVTRLVEDGAPGQVLGVNELRETFEEQILKVKLDHQLMVVNQRIHVGVYPNYSGSPWTVDDFDTTVEPVTNDQGKRFEGEMDVEFVSTVIDTESEYYAYTCGDDINAFTTLANKTSLKVDCRCTLNNLQQPTVELCNADSAFDNGFTLGDGPRFEPLKGNMNPGDIFPERDEIIFGIDRGGLPRRKFVLAALNYKTNTRRFISGEVKDPFTGEYEVGSGPLGGEVSHVRRGPNGEVFVASANEGGQIFQVDPDTGARTLIWQHDNEAYGQCPNGVPALDDPERRISDSQPAPYQITIEARGFTVDPRDGSFYIGTQNSGVPAPGYGMVKISADGSTCRVLTTSQAEERNAYHGGVGQGYEIKAPIKSAVWHEGKILAIASADLLEIDPDTGDRSRIAGSDIPGSSGVPAVSRMFWNEKDQLLMLTGVLPPNNPNIVAVNLETREVWAFLCLNTDEGSPVSACMRGPQATLYIASWPSYQLPDGTFLGGIFGDGFTHYELFEGNSYLFNY